MTDPQHPSLMSSPFPSIDHTAYPHLIDSIIAAAPHASLLSLRAASRAFRARIDRLLVYTVRVTPAKVGTGEGRRIPRTEWWTEPELLGRVRVADIVADGGLWSMPVGDGDRDAKGRSVSPTWPCLVALCGTSLVPRGLRHQNDAVAVRLIRTGRTRSGGDASKPWLEWQTAALSILEFGQPCLPNLFRHVDKLVINVAIDNCAHWNTEDFLSLQSGKIESGANEVVLLYPPPESVDVDAVFPAPGSSFIEHSVGAGTKGHRRTLIKRSLWTALAAHELWSGGELDTSIASVVGLFEFVARFWDDTHPEPFDTLLHTKSMRLYLESGWSTDGLGTKFRYLTAAEYRAHVGEDMFQLESMGTWSRHDPSGETVEQQA